jgi:farnesyl-diphosphate farnesyltransferase
VTAGYLLCRVVDTVEDNETFGIEERDARYRALLDILAGATDAAGFEKSWSHVQGSSRDEIELCAQVHRVLCVLDGVPPAMREAVIRWVTEMARGMQIYSHRPADGDGIVAPTTSDDLQRYCYFVAGTVGHMLTELFCLQMQIGPDHPLAGRLLAHAEAFGTGLQLVNILKDISDDMTRGWCFVPRSACRSQGLRSRDLLEPEHREAAHRAVAPLFQMAETNLDRAMTYALSIPPHFRQIRMFCLLPLWLAIETIGIAYRNDAMFTKGQPVKIERHQVQAVIARCDQACDDDQRLWEQYEAMWAPIARRRRAHAQLLEPTMKASVA